MKKSSVPTPLTLELIEAALSADYTLVRRLASKMAKSLDQQKDAEAATQMRSLIRKRGVPLRASGYMESLPVDTKSRSPLLEEQNAPTEPIFISKTNEDIFNAFVSDIKNVDKLSARGVSAKLCLLLSGPPGTGKSLLASHIASKLDRPLYTARLDSVISSLLGDTAKNIRSIFDFVPAHGGVLFLDEMDAVAKIRDDQHELGELKRVVNTVIQGLDSLDDHAVVIAATNHAQLLDSAIWRRFPYKIEMGLPDEDVREAMWRYYLFEDDPDTNLPRLLAKLSEQLSGADIQTLSFAARRQAILQGRPSVEAASVAWAALRISKGEFVLPPQEGLTSEQKRLLSSLLVDGFGESKAEVARLLDVTRQAVFGYLQGDDDDIRKSA